MTKKITFFLILICLSQLCCATNQPLLVIDWQANSKMPKNFRVINISDMHAIGSGQFSAQQLQTIIKKISNRIIIVDLRQESHGFINGTPISWYGKRNLANKGKNAAQIENLQNMLLSKLKKIPAVTINKILQKNADGSVTKTKPIQVKINTVSSEQDLAKKLHLSYHRFYVSDHNPPTKIQANDFVHFVSKVPKNTWLYFHCRAGEGRTTTFMVMYDILKNANHESFSTIIKRQYLFGGKNLLKLPAKNSYKYLPAQQRIKFLQKFYHTHQLDK